MRRAFITARALVSVSAFAQTNPPQNPQGRDIVLAPRNTPLAEQFLVETLLMTVGGRMAGIVVGAIVSVGISAYARWGTHVSVAAVLLGFVVSFPVGLISGRYPAMKSAALQPVDAMRYE